MEKARISSNLFDRFITFFLTIFIKLLEGTSFYSIWDKNDNIMKNINGFLFIKTLSYVMLCLHIFNFF